jgi:hypothetical protein
MGAIKRTAAPCQTPGLPSTGRARPQRAGDPISTIVEGGGMVRLAGREYHAAALARYDGRQVTVRPTAAGAVLEVRIDGRLLCHAGLVVPGDDDTGSVPAFVPRSPHDGGGSAQLPLRSESAFRWLGSTRSGVYAEAALATVRRHHEPRRLRSAREHLLGHPRRSHYPDTPTTRIGPGSARRRTPDVHTARARGPPILPSVPRPAARRRKSGRTTATRNEARPSTPPSPGPSRPQLNRAPHPRRHCRRPATQQN